MTKIQFSLDINAQSTLQVLGVQQKEVANIKICFKYVNFKRKIEENKKKELTLIEN